MRVVTLDEIKSVLPNIDLLPAIEEGFTAYSAGEAVVPPVGELLLPQGEVHIKYGFIKDHDYYVIKIASGFYENPLIGLSSSSGLMLLFRQATGELAAILLDEGHLTDTRTAVAGAIAAKHLAPENVRRIGIFGTGIQARLQLQYLSQVVPCRDVAVWGRTPQHVDAYCDEMRQVGFNAEHVDDPGELVATCNLIVTTTPSDRPLLSADHLQPGTHITAVGADTPDKQELETDMLKRAEVVVADSIAQCTQRGEIHHALAQKAIERGAIVELGDIVSGQAAGRTSDDQITVADLTGVAVQDIQIATAVVAQLEK